MTVVYSDFDIQIHGLQIQTRQQFEELRAEILRRLESEPLPYQRRDTLAGDVVVEAGEYFAGRFEGDKTYNGKETK